jgi:uncharacterized protein YjaG (DUF416 family)
MNDKWANGVAKKFNRTYNLGLTWDDIHSEINYSVSCVCDRIERKKVKFDWNDDEQVLKYFRYILRTKFCNLAKKKKKCQAEIQLDDVGWENIIYKEKDISHYQVIKSLQDEKIYNYILNNCIGGTAQEKVHKAYKRFGQIAIQLIYRCKWAIKIKERTKKEAIMPDSDAFKGLYVVDIEWLRHLMGDIKGSLEKEKVLEFTKNYDTPFGRRVTKWVQTGMNIIEGDDCFSRGFEQDHNKCMGCSDREDCYKAMQWRIENQTEVKGIDKDFKERVETEPPEAVKKASPKTKTVGLDLKDVTSKKEVIMSKEKQEKESPYLETFNKEMGSQLTKGGNFRKNKVMFLIGVKNTLRIHLKPKDERIKKIESIGERKDTKSNTIIVVAADKVVDAIPQIKSILE